MFVDEAQIIVEAGHGGAGCLSFRREKHAPRGGPDGGNGGVGGSVYLVSNPHLNTLVDFQFQSIYKAENGRPGEGRDANGHSGQDLKIDVPVGTTVFDAETREFIDELKHPDRSVLVAAGGAAGSGNARFKSSVNRAPRKTTPGRAGEKRVLRLELRLLADVGLVGLPNAGKSSLIRKVTNARPKTASYPFTTLKPSLGVVSLDLGRSYTIADIPGLIAGASSGTGLGIRFLKHLRHTRLLFHMVDIASSQEPEQLAESISTIQNELGQFDEELLSRPRWLVLNKIDMLSEDELASRQARILECSGWSGECFAVSAITGAGCKRLVGSAMTWLEQNPDDVSLPEDTQVTIS